MILSGSEAEDFEYKREDLQKPIKHYTMANAEQIQNYEFKPYQYKTGIVGQAVSGVVHGVEELGSVPQKLDLYGKNLLLAIGGYFGNDPKEIERKEQNLETAYRNYLEMSEDRYKYLSPKEMDSLAFKLGANVPNYTVLLTAAYLSGGSALAAGGLMELSDQITQEIPLDENGELDVSKINSEQAIKSVGLATAYAGVSTFIERSFGIGKQLELWRKPIRVGNRLTSRIVTHGARGAVSGVSEGGTEWLQSLASIGLSSEGIEELKKTGIDIENGVKLTPKLRDMLGNTLDDALVGFIMGDASGTAMSIKSMHNAKQKLKREIMPVVRDKSIANNIADLVVDGVVNDTSALMAKELELSSELKFKHGEVWNETLSAVTREMQESGAFRDLSEDQFAHLANTTAKHFADQVLAEANHRGVMIDDILRASDITWDNGIRLARHINMFDALKNPEMIPPETKLKRTSLTQFLRSRGGLLDVGGDLKAMDAIKGMPGLISKKGVGLDDAALSAWEHGYFPELSERPSINDLLEAIDEELRGNKRYNVDEQQTFSDQIAMLEEELDREGIDWRNMSPAEIERAIDEIPELKRLEREAEFYEKFEPDIDYNMTGLTEDERDTILERQGMQLYQSGYVSMKGELEGEYLDADRFEGTGEGNAAHGWGNYVLRDRDINKERYYDWMSQDKVFYNNEEVTADTERDIRIAAREFAYSDSIEETKENIKKGKEKAKKDIEKVKEQIKSLQEDNNLTEEDIKLIEKYKELNEGYYGLSLIDKSGVDAELREIRDKLPNVSDLEDIFSISFDELDGAYNRYNGYRDAEKIDLNKFNKITTGAQYEVDVPEDEFMLDEQMSYNVQSDFVKKTLKSMVSKENLKYEVLQNLENNYSGRQVYNTLSSELGSQKDASKMLEKYGIKGIKYEGGIDGTGYVIFSGKDVPIIQRLLQRGKKAKGITTITPDDYIINLMENADESTLPHEFAHYWLDNMWNYVRSGRASESYMNRWDTIADYLGVKPEQTRLTRGQQEKFASSYEAYLTKGDLPVPAIQSAFDDYDKWLQRVYNDYNKINYQSGMGRRRVRLTDAAVKFFQSMTSGGLEAPALAPVDTGVRLEELRAPEIISDNAVVEVPTMVDTTRVVNITEGEKGVSKVFQREGMINADRIVDELGVEYHKINLEDQAIKATEWVRNNLEEARKVVNGAPAPEGIIDTAIFIAYENEMLRIGNNAEYTRALKIHSQVQTQRGQAIAAERIATNNMTTPAYWLEKVINNREQGLADRLFKGDVKKLRNLITDETKKAAKEVLGKSREEQREYLQKLADRFRKENNVDTLYQLPDEELDKDNVMNVIHNFIEEAMGVTVTQEESDALINKAEQLKKVWDNTLDKNGNPSVESWRTLAEMNKTVEAMSPSHIMTVMSSIYGRSAMLASVKSPTLNIMSNLQNFITEGIVRRFTMGKDKSVNKDAIKEYMKYSWETYNASGFIVSGMQDVSEEIVTLGESRPTTQGRGKLRKIAQVSENIVFKYLMGAPDVVTKDLNFVDTADLLATKIAKDEGAKDISARSTEIFRDAILINPVTEQGKQVRAQAIEQAHIATYTNNSKISDFSLKARQWLNMIGGNKFKLGDVVMPFVKTPANVQMMGLEYGFGSLYTLYKINDIMRNPASEVSQRAIKAAYRNGVGLFLAMMIAAAFDPDDYIPEFDNATTKDRELAKAKNAPFNSIKIGNKWVSLDYLGPLGIPLVAVLNARKGRNLTDQITNFVKAGIGQGMKIPGIKEGLAIWDSLSRTAAYSTTPEKAFDMVSNALLDQVRARTIPAIVNDVAKIIDEYERDTSGSVLDKVQASIPFLREQLPQRYTISGKPLKTEGAASILFFGGRVKTAEDNKLVKEINKLSKKEEQPSISDVTRYGDLRLLSPEKKIKARRDFYKEYAKESKKFISSSSYKKLDAGDKKKALDKIRRNIVKDLKEKYAKDIKREKRRR